MTVTPSHVLKLTEPTDRFLCPLSANDAKYEIDFLSFSIKNYLTKSTIFHIGQNDEDDDDGNESGSYHHPAASSRDDKKYHEGGYMEVDTDARYDNDDDNYRQIKYTFSDDVLRSSSIATSLTFRVGAKEPLPSFRMIERHYFRARLVKSYDFTFSFCIPGSINTWDAVYDVPPLSDALIDEMVRHPFETTSDSFYFVGEELVMHNKARYRYLPTSSEIKEGGNVAGMECDFKRQCGVGGESKGGGWDDCDAKGGDAKECCRLVCGTSERKMSGGHRWSKETDY
eukprot:CAMPEP_0172479306 /NCGR_PEP_ID=MMETSP1066-20121228/3848_1 /TAXON_ID=671091 /ORGANISM="Coscinodiscus wailesii, Strain CCMP2513" /LENGTH=283 /DNA_ID=CAMNT_0013239685 /DNA_START=314 /DNA_END=1165 /DNA_ORIENTATION=+